MDGPDDEVSPAEAARERRRDRDADAQARAGMRTGLAKQFKQVLDSQTKRAQEADGPSRDRDRRRSDGSQHEPRGPARPHGKRKG